MPYSGAVTSDVYRTETGRTLRITESDDGAIKVEVLEEGSWIAGPIGMAGLRLAPTTTRLSGAALRSLPA